MKGPRPYLFKLEYVKKQKQVIIVGLLFVILYSLISLVNHYNFRTFALDLGLYTHAAYQYAHFQLADSAMIKEFNEPMLGGHFDIYLLLFSPLVLIFGTYTLLMVQIVAILLGGLGVYHYLLLFNHQDKKIPIFSAIYFFSFFGVFGALSYDFDSVIVASCLVPWFFISIHLQQKWRSYLLLIFMLGAQENVSLWAFFICLALAIEYRHLPKQMIHLLVLALISVGYFVIIINYIIPSFSSQGAYTGFMYHSLGDNMLDAFMTLLAQPWESVKMLFYNHNQSQYGDFVKAELHIILMASGLPFLLKKPHFLIMLLPVYFQKLFHDNYAMWGIGGQYNMEFTPILAMGIFRVISEFNSANVRSIMGSVVLLLVSASTLRTMDQTVYYTDKSRIRFYKNSHYKREYDVGKVHEHLARIPNEAKVSAQSPFVPHLSLRMHIYQFPIIHNSNYLVYSKYENSYPLSAKEFEDKVKIYENSPDWEILYNREVTILRKVHKEVPE